MPSPSTGETSWLAGYAPLISPAISVVLSAAVSWFTAKHITRKSNLRASFITILAQLDYLHSAATELLLCSGADENIQARARSVNLADHRLGRGITEVFRAYPPKYGTTPAAPVPHPIVQARIKLRKLVTDSDKALPTRNAHEADDPIFDELDGLCESLRRAIREAAEDLGIGGL